MDYIELDPTYKGGNNAGKYAKWILALANKGTLDNIGHVKDILTRFDSEKNNLINKDIMKYKSLDELENMLNDESSYAENLIDSKCVIDRKHGEMQISQKKLN